MQMQHIIFFPPHFTRKIIRVLVHRLSVRFSAVQLVHILYLLFRDGSEHTQSHCSHKHPKSPRALRDSL